MLVRKAQYNGDTRNTICIGSICIRGLFGAPKKDGRLQVLASATLRSWAPETKFRTDPDQS